MIINKNNKNEALENHEQQYREECVVVSKKSSLLINNRAYKSQLPSLDNRWQPIHLTSIFQSDGWCPYQNVFHHLINNHPCRKASDPGDII
jgi:hypothetical protein